MSNLRRALRLLELLTQAPDGARLTDLAQSLGVNRAIPHRALSELIEMGYVRQDPDTERYLATFKLGALGLQQLEVAGLGRWTNEALRDLADKTKELVRMAVMTDGGLRWVAKAQGSNSMLILDPANGAEPMLHATATARPGFRLCRRTRFGESLARASWHSGRPGRRSIRSSSSPESPRRGSSATRSLRRRSRMASAQSQCRFMTAASP